MNCQREPEPEPELRGPRANGEPARGTSRRTGLWPPLTRTINTTHRSQVSSSGAHDTPSLTFSVDYSRSAVLSQWTGCFYCVPTPRLSRRAWMFVVDLAMRNKMDMIIVPAVGRSNS
jgi:hypothetical protein